MNITIFNYFYVWDGLSNDDVGWARHAVFQEIQPGAGFKTGDLVQEVLGGLPKNDSLVGMLAHHTLGQPPTVLLQAFTCCISVVGRAQACFKSYHSNCNGAVGRVNYTTAQMLAMVVNERQDDCHSSFPVVLLAVEPFLPALDTEAVLGKCFMRCLAFCGVRASSNCFCSFFPGSLARPLAVWGWGLKSRIFDSRSSS